MYDSSIQTAELELPPGVVFYRQRSDYRHRAVAGDPPVVQEELPEKYGYGRYINLGTDFGFKRVLAGPANHGPMKHFLNCLFQRQERIANIEFRPTEYVGDTRDSKTAIFDVLVIGDRGEQYLVEMQLANQECFKDRAYFYDSRMFTEQLPRGNAHRFCDIKETHFIGILDFILPDSPKGDYVHDIGPAYLSTGKSFYDKQRFKFIELPKFNKPLNELKTGLDKWLHLLKHLHEMTDIPSIFHEPVFQEVFRIAEQSNLNQKEQTMYRTSLQDQLDYQESIRTAKKEGLQKGIEKGIEQGIEQEKTSFVKSLLENTDFGDERIASIAAINVGRVRSLRAEMLIH